MNFNEKGSFSEIMRKAGMLVSKMISIEEIESRFEYLEDYPIKIIEKAVTYAYDSRDPQDEFLKTQIVTGLEIKNAANEIIETEGKKTGSVSSCKVCHGNGWIAEEVRDASYPKGHLVAHPCQCLYNSVKEELLHKRKFNPERDSWLQTVVKCHEAYQRRIG